MERQKLLVIDDTTSIISPWKKELRKYFETMEAIGAHEAVTKIRENNFAAVIVNLSLSHIDGQSVALKIKELFPHVPLIVIARQSEINLVRHIAGFGISGFLFIPFEARQLLEMLQRILKIDLKQVEAETEKEKDTEKKMNNNNKKEKENEADLPSLYYEGQSFLAREEIDNAINVFNKILQVKRVKDSWKRYRDESYFQLARCFFKKGDYTKSLSLLKEYLQLGALTDNYKEGYFVAAQCYEKLNQPQKAILIYKKLVDLPPMDSVSTRAKKRLRALMGNHK